MSANTCIIIIPLFIVVNINFFPFPDIHLSPFISFSDLYTENLPHENVSS